MKSCVSFVSLLAVGNCDHHISQSPTHKSFHRFRNISSITKKNCNKSKRKSCIHKPHTINSHPSLHNIRGGGDSSTQVNLSATATMASLFAGSMGGAIGVGIAYPFDTLSTKAQVISGKGSSENQISMIKSIGRIWKNDGVRGFFEGVLVTMIGQALIKSIQFAVNEITYLWLEKNTMIQSTLIKMAIAGTLAGLLSSFVVSPVELLKIRMQAQNKQVASAANHKKDDDATTAESDAVTFDNELECAQWMIKNEGWKALFCHGLWITIIREIPSFAFYFMAYGILAKSAMADILGGHAAPLIFGAMAGWAMWIPTYPIDIVKTIEQAQTTEKNKNGTNKNEVLNSRQITAKLYRSGGIRAFFDGLEPKLARAAVKHAVTFWVYEVIMGFLRPHIQN